MARQLLARLAVTPDAAVPDLPFLHRALLLPLLSAASVLLRLPLLLSSSPLRPRRTLPVPVVSVGNLTWGGNGKTPMVDFLARRFHNIGISPLILTRGYAGGDESKMLQRRLADTTTFCYVRFVVGRACIHECCQQSTASCTCTHTPPPVHHLTRMGSATENRRGKEVC